MKRLIVIIPIFLISIAFFISGSGCGYYYTVEEGDTIYSIARRYNLETDELIKANKIEDPRKLRTGQKIRIPRIDKYRLDDEIEKSTTEKGESAKKPEPIPSNPERTGKPPPDNAAPVRPSGLSFIWPTKGTVVRPYGKGSDGRINDGLDIGAPMGAPVVASESGEVILSSDRYPAYGNMVVIKHKNEYVTLYAHNRRNLVSIGHNVTKGQSIAEVGSTGRTKTPILHFEIRIVSTPVDPLKYLPR